MKRVLTAILTASLLTSGAGLWSQAQSPPAERVVRAAPATSQIKTLQGAIDQARDGDTILIQGPGVFHEHLVVTKSVHLISTNAAVIDGDGTGTPLILAAPNVSIQGLTLRNSGSDLAAFDCGILITAPNVEVRQCRVESDAFGIYVKGVNGCTVERNEIFGDGDVPSAKRGNGIHLWKTSGNRIAGNVIHDKRDGIYLTYADKSVIAGNRVAETRFGIHYMYSHQNQILTNTLTRNAVGATLMFSRGLLVEGNVMTANRRHGLVLKQLDSSRFLRNVVAGQNRGLFVQQANQNRFEGNLIATNDIGLYLSNSSEQNVFVGNAFIRNVDQVWQPPFEAEQGRKGPNSFSEKARGNYWSDYTGSDRNGDGIGDVPYHETDVFGYLVDRHPDARVLAFSPAVALMRKSEEWMPLLDTLGVTDLAPLMQPIPAEAPGITFEKDGGMVQSLDNSAATVRR